MSLNQTFFTLLFFFSILLIGCREDSFEQVIIEDPVSGPSVTVKSSILARIIDDNEQPVADAAVTVNNQTLFTDAAGLVVVEDATLNSKGTFIRVEKSGYFPGGRRIYGSSTAAQYVNVKLLSKNVVGSINAQTGGTVSTSEGAIIELPANGIIDSDGNAFTGSVQVNATWLDPTADDLGEIMPGNLEGITTGSERVGLASFGMLGVELESLSGESLNLGNGGEATLTFPVPAELVGTAPATIPLWFFDEDLGTWVEEGSATLQGDQYVGNVTHFTFWNCDAPFPLTDLTVCFRGLEDQPFFNHQVVVTTLSFGTASYAVTDENGCVNGLVMQNEVLLLELLSKCGEVIYSEEIGPFTTDEADLGNITVQSGGFTNLLTIQGTLVDCDGNPLNNGVVQVEIGSLTEYIFASNGNFIGAVDNCDDATVITVAGFGSGAQSSIASDPIDVVVTGSFVQIGTIEVCESTVSGEENYVNVIIDGEEYQWNTLLDTSLFNASGATYDPVEDLFFVNLGVANFLPFDSTTITLSFYAAAGGSTILTDTTMVNYLIGTKSPHFFLNDNLAIYCDQNVGSKCIDIIETIEILEFGAVGEQIKGEITATVPIYEVDESNILGEIIYFPDTSLPLGTFPVTVQFSVERLQ